MADNIEDLLRDMQWQLLVQRQSIASLWANLVANSAPEPMAAVQRLRKEAVESFHQAAAGFPTDDVARESTAAMVKHTEELWAQTEQMLAIRAASPPR